MKPDSYELLGNRNFRLLWIGQTVSVLGDGFGWMALLATVYRLGGSALNVGLLFSLMAISALLAGPPAGVLADRLDRKALMAVADLARAGIVFSLVWVKSLGAIYVLALLLSALKALFDPAAGALVPGIVQPSQLVRANSLMRVTESIMVILGTALGGTVAGFLGVRAAFAADAVSYLLSVAAVLMIRVRRRPEPFTEEPAAFIKDLVAGLAYAVKSRVVLFATGSFAAFYMGSAVVNTLGLVFAETVLDVGIQGFGLMESFWGIGLLVGGTLSLALTRVLGVVATLILSLTLAGFGFLVYATFPFFPLTLTAVIFIGTANSLGVIGSNSLLQHFAPDVLLGRVFAARGTVLQVVWLACTSLAGLAADRVTVWG